jgi:DNA anti-recombination protein RmuC
MQPAQAGKAKKMSEIDSTPRTYSGALLAAIAIALVAAIAGLVWCSSLGGRITSLQADVAEAKQQNRELAAELRETDARLRVATDELGKSLGLTQKQLDDRAQAIIQRQEADSQRFESAQKQTTQQVNAVSTEVSHVKSDVGGVRSDLGKTQNELASTVSQLQSVRGDLSGTNSVIARNHDELVMLEHKSDRRYYEFTLNKGQRKPVGTVSMELKKADIKKSRFTVNIFADDKSYEKKDRNVNEPLQFYSGREPALFEVVVFNISSKNQVSGYLSTPKNAPVPANVP